MQGIYTFDNTDEDLDNKPKRTPLNVLWTALYSCTLNTLT